MNKSLLNWNIILRSQGALLLMESAFMALPTVYAYYINEFDKLSFLLSTSITAFIGGLLFWNGRRAPRQTGIREGHIIVVSVWIIYSLFGMLPFYLSGAIPTFTDAFFETISGFTTTGTTILNDIEAVSQGCLLWRAMTQWIGGMGMIVLSVAILPIFGLGGMQVYSVEATGVTYDKLSPRISSTSRKLWGLYAGITLIEVLVLCIFDMPTFDAVCHSLATVSTGGFSTRNLSVGAYDSAGIQYTITFFTFIGGLNFSLLYLSLFRDPKTLFKDEETQWYSLATLFLSIVLAVGIFLMYFTHIEAGFCFDHVQDISSWSDVFHAAEKAFRCALFEVVSTMTSCGFAIDDYMNWRPFMWCIIFAIMFMGACTGSTGGGVKWMRLIVMAKNARQTLVRLIHRNGVLPLLFNGKIITDTIFNSVIAFFGWYALILVGATLGFCALGINFTESLSSAASAMGNIGPALGQYGPSGNYADFPTIGKWIYAALMLIGRLEILAVVMVLSPTMWRRKRVW